jgi:hypothetical protein
MTRGTAPPPPHTHTHAPATFSSRRAVHDEGVLRAGPRAARLLDLRPAGPADIRPRVAKDCVCVNASVHNERVNSGGGRKGGASVTSAAGQRGNTISTQAIPCSGAVS